jgi:beta-phosphoglucomutase-like phosphatase (HAD superfamily)
LKIPIGAVVDGSMVTKSKPAPDLFVKAAELLGVAPVECVVVEDAAAGIEAGKRAGMYTLGLGPAERVGAADLILPDLRQADLESILISLSGLPRIN